MPLISIFRFEQLWHNYMEENLSEMLDLLVSGHRLKYHGHVVLTLTHGFSSIQPENWEFSICCNSFRKTGMHE